MAFSVLIAGASGLVGKFLLQRCLEHPGISTVYTVGRSPGMVQHTKLKEYLVDFNSASPYAGLSAPSAVFCCLGTTLAKAGSREAFRKVDYQYVLDLAQWARGVGCPSFHLISAVGADAASPVFYSRIKGEVERDVTALQFEETVIYRPSLLLGARKEGRLGEALAQRIMPLFNPLLSGMLTTYKPIEATQLAATMLRRALVPRKGIQVLSGKALFSS